MKSNPSLLQAPRDWFKQQNASGRFIGLRSLWRYVRNLYHFHPRERFVNRWKVGYKTRTGSWRLMSIDAGVLHRVFHVCVRQSAAGLKVVKLPRGDNQYSARFIKALRPAEAFGRYKGILTGLKDDAWLHDHCVAVSQIRRDGGYDCESVDGFNLAVIREQILISEILTRSQRDELVRAIRQLLQDLNGYHGEHHKLTGDWRLHNLVFSPERRAIINVDAEGFFTYSGTSEEAHLPSVKANLRDLIELVGLVDSPLPEDAKVLDLFRVMDEVRRSGEQYSGSRFVVGYHSLELNGRHFRGQRECSERLADVPFDFRDKVVLDLGCNCGGMLHFLSKTIRKGYGFDYNSSCVNAALLIKNFNRSANLEFYAFDLDGRDLSLLKSFLLGDKVDICFLLSVCRWLQNWREVVHEASKLSKVLLFEANGTAAQQDEQVAFLNQCYQHIHLIRDRSPDDPIQGARRLYLCSHEP